MSFVSLQLRRGLAAVRRESLLSSALIAETARGGTCGRHNKSVFLREEEAEFTLRTNQTGFSVEMRRQLIKVNKSNLPVVTVVDDLEVISPASFFKNKRIY